MKVNKFMPYLLTFLITDCNDTKSGLSLTSSDQHFLIIASTSSSAIVSSSNGRKPSSQMRSINSVYSEQQLNSKQKKSIFIEKSNPKAKTYCDCFVDSYEFWC